METKKRKVLKTKSILAVIQSGTIGEIIISKTNNIRLTDSKPVVKRKKN